MIDYDTILSTTEDKMTLLQWLKKVEEALKDASATTFKVNKKGDATLTFSIVFADGSEIESGEIVLQQGESVESAAIVNGHLILTLTNGDELDAGTLFNGNINIAGDLSTTGKFSQGAPNANTLIGRWDTDNENLQVDNLYTRFIEINNIIYIVLCVKITNTGEDDISLSDGARIAQAGPLYPPSAGRIFDVDGDNGQVIKTGTILVLSDDLRLCADRTSTSYGSLHSCNFMRLGAVENGYRIEMRSKGGLAIPAGASRYMFARMFLTLF